MPFLVLIAKCLALFCATVAQLVERVLGKDEVAGSNPASSFDYICLYAD